SMASPCSSIRPTSAPPTLPQPSRPTRTGDEVTVSEGSGGVGSASEQPQSSAACGARPSAWLLCLLDRLPDALPLGEHRGAPISGDLVRAVVATTGNGQHDQDGSKRR